MKKTIEFNPFSISSVDDAIREFDEWSKDYDKKVDLFLETLAKKGVEIAKLNVTSMDAIFTGELLKSITSSRKGKGCYAIISNSKHSAFVEFGTGQVGQENPYPYPLPDGVTWNYNKGATIFEISDGQYGWYYPTKDGKWKLTQGMPARPYMYETAMELSLRTTIEETAKEVFG
jgi:hypothetical protein